MELVLGEGMQHHVPLPYIWSPKGMATQEHHQEFGFRNEQVCTLLIISDLVASMQYFINHLHESLGGNLQ